jgi:two-component system, OmpR family, sensor histidine kinase KdpD
MTGKNAMRQSASAPEFRACDLRRFALTTLAVALALGLSWILNRFLPLPNLSLVFLMPVLFAGVRYGLWPSLYAAVLGFSVYNFFFTEPYLTFVVHNTGDLATLVFYLLVAVVVGNMAARLKTHMEKLAEMATSLEESRMLSETEKLRAALLSSISHDLRTPLSTIIGSATSLQEFGDRLDPQARQELLKNVMQEAERLNRFIQNLLDMTRLGHGNLKPQQDWVEFRDLVGRALKRVEKELDTRKVEINADPGLDILYTDPVLMEQVFVNILDNAAKYAPAGSRIRISFTAKGENIFITIADEGPGIPRQDREHVFDMFFRIRAADMKVAGTGLGLAICRGLVEAHGGAIRVENGLNGKGTSIVLIFPAAMAGSADERKKESAYG